MANTGSEILHYFTQRGLSPAAAAGIVGNAQQESSLNPNAAGGGLFQDQGGRGASGPLSNQLNAAWRELNGSERGTLNALRGVKTPQEAARVFSERFERPGIPMLGNREKYAVEALKNYGGGSGGEAGQMLSEGTQGASTATPGSYPAGLATLIQQLTKPAASSGLSGIPIPRASEGVKATPTEIQHGEQSPSSIAGLVTQIAGEGGSSETITKSNVKAGGGLGQAHGSSGEAAVKFGVGSLGKYAESEGANLGPELNKLEQTFGMKGEPWCAIFATTAAANGNPNIGKTASVATINQWASEGSHGYSRGLLPSSKAQPGDLLTFGNDHVALVKEVRGGRIVTIEGNADGSGGVVELSHRVGEGMIARPHY